MGSVALFPSAIQPIVRGALWFPFAVFYSVLGVFKLVVGVVALPFGS
jgi:hypothetical protein